MPIVAITDSTFPSLSVERELLEPHGCEVREGQCRTPEAVAELVAEADYVITQFAPIDARAIEAMKRARLIARYGIGVDNVDLDAARNKGIAVTNVPDYCIDEVADHTLAFILASTRKVLPNSRKVHSGEWGLATALEQMTPLCNLTVGVIGFGRIGREVARRLSGFRPTILVSDPVVPAEAIREEGATRVSLDELLERSDVVTLHCPSTTETRNLLDSAAFARMKPGVIVVNVGRGDLIDSDALVAALNSRKVGAAALDVFSTEPIPAGHPILKRDNVILSSHVASASVKAGHLLRESVAQSVLQAIRGDTVTNIVNGLAGPRTIES
jgi:D-3-phosphoglycerate dehydrogenase